MSKFVLLFNEIDKTSLLQVGGKGANLGEMMKADFPVPQGFCITTTAFIDFIQKSDEMNGFFDLLERIDSEKLGEVRSLGKKIRAHLEELSMPEEIENSILNNWKTLGKEKAYAVRSSATAEDLPNASFAGQQETYLNVKGKEQLLKSIKQCWASLFTDRAIVYRSKNGFDHKVVFLSVVIQEMLFPEVSGIMFTADPIKGNRNTIAIDASFGLGEALVSGIVSADLYQVNRGQIIEKKIASKKIGIYGIPSGRIITENLPKEKQDVQALDDEKIMELSKLGKAIETHYGSPQDIEWCLCNNKFYIVQSRPITSLYPVPKAYDPALHVFFSFGHQQMMTDVLCPMSRSLWRTFIPFGKSNSPSEESTLVLEAGARLFIDLTKILQVKLAQKFLLVGIGAIDELMSGGIKEVIERPEFRQSEEPGIKKKVIKAILPLVSNVAKNLLFKNPLEALYKASEIMKSTLQESESYINRATGAERIRRIQQSTGTLALQLAFKISVYPASSIIAMKLIDYFTKKWLDEDSSLEVLNKSLPGNVTTELGLKVGDLADLARGYPEIIEYLKTAKKEDFYEGLAKIDVKGVFLKEFTNFMDQYGMRCPGEIDIQSIRWNEDPTLLVSSILTQIKSLKSGEHREKFKAFAKEAEEVSKNVLLKLREISGGFFKVKIISRLIKVFRNAMGLRELPKYIIVQHFEICRKALLEEGTSLTNKGILKEQRDIFYLTLPELVLLLEENFEEDLQDQICLRKSEMERYQKLTPPRVITSEGECVTGKRKNINAPKGALLGTPVSSGIVEGYARVILKAEEGNLNPGEILIAPFTDPGWTPLFSAAKGLVMEVGGMMTHGAVIAREYGLPAVVGIDKATEYIQDGDYVRVNGNEGYVQILKKRKI